MVGVVAEHAVESGVAILESAHVHWYDGDAGQQCLVAHQLTGGAGDAAHQHVDRACHLVDMFHHLKTHILVAGKSSHKLLRLVFVFQEFYVEVLLRLGVQHTEQCGAGGVAQPHKSISGGVGLA